MFLTVQLSHAGQQRNAGAPSSSGELCCQPSVKKHNASTLMAGNVSGVFTERQVSSTQAVTNYERRVCATGLNFIKL